MIAVSDAWKSVHDRFILPESFIEIDCGISEVGLQESASASGTNVAEFSDVEAILGTAENSVNKKYATLEMNLWTLDGTLSLLEDSGEYKNAAYVSNVDQGGVVTLTLPEVHTVAIPGVTILWSSKFGEYPPVFTVSAYNGEELVAEATVIENTQQHCLVDLEISNYDKVIVTVHNWCLPNRRPRIEWVYLGHMLTLDKGDILSYTHTQSGDLLTGEVPKYSIEFSLDNTDSRWNPSNPSGMERFLSERQKLTVRYGLDIDGTVEWIKAGTFYLSEWSAPSNGLEAKFVARDVFEFLLSVNLNAYVYGSLDFLAEWATDLFLPETTSLVLDPSLADYSADHSEGTSAEIVQKCANASCCILRYDRKGVLHVEPLNKAAAEYHIPLALAYSHPEITLSKPLKKVAVEYGAEEPYELTVAESGETQTVDNSFVTDQTQAANIAQWVRDVLLPRKTISGEFRADPRLDLYDVVSVESKFGTFSPVVITELQYTFSGCFKATYTGRIVGGE